MSRESPSEWIVPTRGARTLPAVEVLTGRGFVTGKSGSGKSNSASVIAEELLENGYNLLVVDPEGEYYALKERYEVLHVGGDDLCDVEVGPRHAERIAEIALERNMPVVLDVSGFLDGEEARDLIEAVVRHLFQKEKDVRKPFLLMVEEMQEYLPQQGGQTDLAKMLERVAKRGRKRGLGLLGMSQRPSSVDKDFITQCDWMVWHRLTWKTDLEVVRNILGGEKASAIEEFDAGEGYLMTDWDETVERVTFRRKRTHDAGATPGLEQYERPDLKSVSEDLVRAVRGAVPADMDVGGPDFGGANGGANGGTNGDANGDARTDATADAALNEVDLMDVANAQQPAGDATGEHAPSDATPDTSDTAPDASDDVADASDGATPDATDGDAAAEAAESASAETNGDTPADTPAVSLDDIEDDALRAHVEQLHRQNRELQATVAQLRDESRAGTASRSSAAGGSGTERTASAGRGSATGGRSAGAGGRADLPRPWPARRAERARPPRPPEPERPPERDGVGGALLEFGDLMVYLWRVLRYRVRLAGYRLRTR